MATKPAKQAIESSAATDEQIRFAPDITPPPNLEDAIADQLLDDIDWSKVKAAMLTKVKQRFITWLTSGSDRPVNISQFPELAVLPSGDEQEKAA